jgi:hypothetical protein
MPDTSKANRQSKGTRKCSPVHPVFHAKVFVKLESRDARRQDSSPLPEKQIDKEFG